MAKLLRNTFHLPGTIVVKKKKKRKPLPSTKRKFTGQAFFLIIYLLELVQIAVSKTSSF